VCEKLIEAYLKTLRKKKTMINLEQIQQDIKELPEEAQTLLTDFIELLKKRYSLVKKLEIDSKTDPDTRSSTLEILKESGLIGCISAESDLSTNYKSVLKEALDTKYDNR
jgi:SET domain-containing protein